ncbi:ABC-F family ATP-binding cassette domain-containing protein [Caenispirillum bisanense]|uniref:ABC-F family ATP-binding cassette domain-containing protein n=1 Tax=Caenispirillum bisanense TaxID=414052 RepID=UPI0031D1EA82
MPPAPPLLTLKDIHLSLGDKALFTGVEVAVGRGDRVSLVGRNGSGKSTLLKIAAGVVQPDGGEVWVQPGITVAYLPQEPDVSGFATVHDYVAAGLSAAHADDLHKVDILLDAVGLTPDMDPSTLSGGEGRRAAIARLFVSGADILLLDEPTNHLDLPTIQWLEEELLKFRGGLVLISHDRAFLNRLTNTTFWLDRGVVRRNDAGFRDFDRWSEEEMAREAAELEKLDKLIAEEAVWAHRTLPARRRRNMGRLNRLESLRQERAQSLARTGSVTMEAETGQASGKLVIEAEGVAKRFGDRTILRDFRIRVLRGDKIGIVGPNGAGKSTLLKILTGQLDADEGRVRLGTNLSMVYLDQRRSTLDLDKTIWDTLADSGGDHINVRGTPRHVVGYMKDFLFDATQARSPVSSLSGGERNRLLLAKTLARPSNFLVLDEPTNDLDMDTLDLLQEVLSEYDGTLLIVSHDRDFLDRVVTSTILVPGDGTAIEYAGGYTDMMAQRGGAAPVAEDRQKPADKATPAPKAAAEKPKPRTAKLSYKQQRDLELLPKQIEELTAKVETLNTRLTEGDLYQRDPAAFQKTAEALDAARSDLEQAEERWLELEMLREEIESGG